MRRSHAEHLAVWAPTAAALEQMWSDIAGHDGRGPPQLRPLPGAYFDFDARTSDDHDAGLPSDASPSPLEAFPPAWWDQPDGE